jgi:hypothetical protein
MKQPVRALTPSEEMRFLVGVAVQPFVAAALGLIAFPVFLLDRNGQTLAGGSPDLADAAGSVAAGVGLVALVVTLAGALPTAVWLLKRRPIPLSESLAFGVGFGNLPFAFGAVMAGTHGISGFIRGVAFSSLLGAAGGAVFWYIALRPPVDGSPSIRD